MAAENTGSLIGNMRCLLQDILTPDLKALSARMEASESRFTELRSGFHMEERQKTSA